MPETISLNLIGRSGSGKGTQAKLLMKHFDNLFYLATGSLFRDLAEKNTLVGKKINKIIDEGGLPFDDLAIALLLHEISYNIKEDQGILFDGATRRIGEAKVLDSFLAWMGKEKNFHPILIDISREEAFKRLTKRRICKKCSRLIPWVEGFKELKVCDNCGGELVVREDDNPDSINNRLDFFDQRVMEVVDYYREKGKLIEIDGEQPIKDVFDDILKALK